MEQSVVDMRQKQMSGFKIEDANGIEQWNFTTDPWTVTRYGPDGLFVETFEVDRDGKRIEPRVIEIGASDENADWLKFLPGHEPPEGFAEYWEEALAMFKDADERLIESLKENKDGTPDK